MSLDDENSTDPYSVHNLICYTCKEESTYWYEWGQDTAYDLHEEEATIYTSARCPLCGSHKYISTRFNNVIGHPLILMALRRINND